MKIYAVACHSTPAQPAQSADEALANLERFADGGAEENRRLCEQAVRMCKELGWTAEPAVHYHPERGYTDIEIRVSKPLTHMQDLIDADRQLVDCGFELSERWGLTIGSDTSPNAGSFGWADLGCYAEADAANLPKIA